MRFKAFSSEEQMLYRQLNLRENIITAYEVMARSTLQRIVEVVQLANKNPTLDHEDLAKLWNSKVTKSPSALSEEVTTHYVKTSVDVFNRCLQHV